MRNRLHRQNTSHPDPRPIPLLRCPSMSALSTLTSLAVQLRADPPERDEAREALVKCDELAALLRAAASPPRDAAPPSPKRAPPLGRARPDQRLSAQTRLDELVWAQPAHAVAGSPAIESRATCTWAWRPAVLWKAKP